MRHGLPGHLDANFTLDGEILATEMIMSDLDIDDMDIFDVQIR